MTFVLQANISSNTNNIFIVQILRFEQNSKLNLISDIGFWFHRFIFDASQELVQTRRILSRFSRVNDLIKPYFQCFYTNGFFKSQVIKLIKVLDVQNNFLVFLLMDFANDGVQQAIRFEADKK